MLPKWPGQRIYPQVACSAGVRRTYHLNHLMVRLSPIDVPCIAEQWLKDSAVVGHFCHTSQHDPITKDKDQDPMEPEVVMNLWVFIQAVGPMNLIYELGVRPYMMSGSDDEMTKLLKDLAVSDFHFAHRFALPDRYHVKITEEAGMIVASSSDTIPEAGGVRTGLALVRPDISGMHQMEYFKEALDVVEKTLPTRRLGIDGVETYMPRVNRKNLLSVITNVNVDSNGNQVPLLPGDPRRQASPSAVANLWIFHDERAKAIYAVSGRGYMVHGSDSEKTRILKTLAPHDFSMVQAQSIPKRFSVNV